MAFMIALAVLKKLNKIGKIPPTLPTMMLKDLLENSVIPIKSNPLSFDTEDEITKIAG